MSSDDVEKFNNVSVLVLGAGVAGLTAAHELAERGFQVTVIEAAEDPRSVDALPRLDDDHERGEQRPTARPAGRSRRVIGPMPAVGGMARTQWGWMPPRPRGDRFQTLMHVHPPPRGWSYSPAVEPGRSQQQTMQYLRTSTEPLTKMPSLQSYLGELSGWWKSIDLPMRANRRFMIRRYFLAENATNLLDVIQPNMTSEQLVHLRNFLGLNRVQKAQSMPTLAVALREWRQIAMESAGRAHVHPELLVEGSVTEKEWAVLEKELRARYRAPAPNLVRHMRILSAQARWENEKLDEIRRKYLHSLPLSSQTKKDLRPAHAAESLRSSYKLNEVATKRFLCSMISFSRAVLTIERLISTGLKTLESKQPPWNGLDDCEIKPRWARKDIWAVPVAHSEPRRGHTVRIRAQGQRVPGEHGYRFFPAFYGNLLEQLQRIRIYEDAPLTDAEQRENRRFRRMRRATQSELPLPHETSIPSGRTVYDNLRPVKSTSFAFAPPNHLVELRRGQPTSSKEVLDNLDILLDGLGWSLREVTHFQLKVFEYLSTSQARRRELEDTSWAQFLGATGRRQPPPLEETFSAPFLEQLQRWPRALIGLDAWEGDTRTFGSILVQLVLDQARNGFVDGTLNAPTTEAWFDPWAEDLVRRLGVRFVTAKVVGLEIKQVQKENAVKVSVQGVPEHALRHAQPAIRSALPPPLSDAVEIHIKPDSPNDTTVHNDGDAHFDYLVLALPPGVLRRVLDRHDEFADLPDALDHFCHELEPRERAATQPLDGTCLREPEPKGPMRHFTGVQLFFPNETRIDPGHVYYPDASLGLSSISQVQFRTARPSLRSYGGSLSLVVGSLHEAVSVDDEDAASLWGKTGVDIAKAVWGQVSPVLDATRHPGMDPAWIWVDRDLMIERRTPGEEVSKKGKPRTWRNRSPYLVNLAGDWKHRPGTDEDKSPMYAGSTVVCGQLSRTHTRLGTMEASCESAKHAVNTLLADLRTRTEALDDQKKRDWRQRASHVNARPSMRTCPIHDPEEHEPADLAWTLDLDARLHARGVPHIFQALRLYDVLEAWFPDEAQEEASDGRTFLDAITTLVSGPEYADQAQSQLRDLARKRGLDEGVVSQMMSFVQRFTP